MSDETFRAEWEQLLDEAETGTDLSFLDPLGSEEGSAPTGSADDAVESILDRATPAAGAIFAELRQRLQALVKKKRPPS